MPDEQELSPDEAARIADSVDGVLPDVDDLDEISSIVARVEREMKDD